MSELELTESRVKQQSSPRILGFPLFSLLIGCCLIMGCDSIETTRFWSDTTSTRTFCSPSHSSFSATTASVLEYTCTILTSPSFSICSLLLFLSEPTLYSSSQLNRPTTMSKLKCTKLTERTHCSQWAILSLTSYKLQLSLCYAPTSVSSFYLRCLARPTTLMYTSYPPSFCSLSWSSRTFICWWWPGDSM